MDNTRFTVAELADFTRNHASMMNMVDGKEAGRVTMFLDNQDVKKFKQVDDCMRFMASNEETIRHAIAATKKKPRK